MAASFAIILKSLNLINVRSFYLMLIRFASKCIVCEGLSSQDSFITKIAFRVNSFAARFQTTLAGLGGSVGCAVRLETRRSRVQPPPPPPRGRQHSFVEIDHEIFSTVILFLPLIQEGQLSVSGKRMCTILVNRLED